VKRARLRSWWQRVKHHPWITVAVVVGIVFIVVFILGYWLNWDWTGLGPYTPPTQASNFQRGKTLWDWLNLLGVFAIPAVVGLGAAWFTAQQGKVSDRENTDNQREAALQGYIDKLSELLLEKKLRDSKSNDDEIRTIARVRTLRLLSRLDGKRKGDVLQFLYELGLLGRLNAIVELHGANLRGTNLRDTHLVTINLFKADLRDADLLRADLKDADLRGTKLSDANLSEADLNFADLSDADLSNANLSETNLSQATVSTEQLEKAKSLKGATMPDGSIHP
jgi:uncharacterized protein YjbI with pentapeptide repeats